MLKKSKPAHVVLDDFKFYSERRRLEELINRQNEAEYYQDLYEKLGQTPDDEQVLKKMEGLTAEELEEKC